MVESLLPLKATGITVEDIIDTLRTLKLVRFWKGQHVLVLSQALIDSYLAASKKMRVVDPSKLEWAPKASGGRSTRDGAGGHRTA